VLQTETNGWTCFIGDDGTPECDDQNAMEWRNALWPKQPPTKRIGVIFMLAVTPARAITTRLRDKHLHWVQTGPHVMIVGGAANEMLSPYPRDLDV
jgi:hypothetical protein